MERIVRHRVGEYADFVAGAPLALAVTLALFAASIVFGLWLLVVLACALVAVLMWLLSWPVSLVRSNAAMSLRTAASNILHAEILDEDPFSAAVRTTRESRRERERTAQAAAAESRAAAEARAEAAAAQDRARAQAAAEEAARQWLQGPPPTLYVPRRFTEHWFAANLPTLHPAQIDPLFRELLARGWTNERIEQRLHRYLLQNPFLEGVTSEQLSAGGSSVALASE